MAVAEQLAAVQEKVRLALAAREGRPEQAGAECGVQPVRLVAVSKTKPVEMLQEAYEAGHRHFGENYVQELVDKHPQMPEDTQWHFIGHLQSNKVTQLIKGCPTLACLETLDSEKLARTVDKAWLASGSERKLRVMVQINSSGEESKNGVTEEEVVELCALISTELKGLQLAGLMTIGAPDYSGCRTEDFELLHRSRERVAEAIGVQPASLELSMGMSNDYENAIREGSTSVRVGSAIFGVRHYPARA